MALATKEDNGRMDARLKAWGRDRVSILGVSSFFVPTSGFIPYFFLSEEQS